MAAGVTRLSDVIVPEIFTGVSQLRTQEKSRLIASGAVVPDARLNAALDGAGLTFNETFFKDLENDEENVSNDDPTDLSDPNKIGMGSEIQVRLSRNNSWSSMDLVATLLGADPMAAIAERVSDYWTRRMQAAFVATMNGIFADNAAAPTGGDTHVQNDMISNISGASFVDGVTNFSAEAFVDASVTMGDSMDDLSLVMMHSVVYARALKNNLIDFIPDSINPGATPDAAPGRARGIPTFLGREIIVDDGVPHTGGVFDTWIFGRGAFGWGSGSPAVPTEVERVAAAGNGGGQETLHNRVEWAMHPVGYAYVGTPAKGGPSNATSANNLANAASWSRRFNERKQIRVARLVTREF
jgi:hypothetical protein